jgi:hypothetical protein
MRAVVQYLIFVIAVNVAANSAEPKLITQDELVRRTQEMFDAVAPGNAAPWQKYWAEDGMFFDEKGRNLDKRALVADITPLPNGYTGKIKVRNVKSRISDDTVVLSYDMDETMSIFGQYLSARFHATDTWLYRDGKWQIVAGQVFRYYEDPASINLDPKSLDRYIGTYELAPKLTMTITKEGGQLFSQREKRPKEILLAEAPGVFFRKGIEGRRLFRYAKNGSVEALIDRRNSQDIIWKKIK